MKNWKKYILLTFLIFIRKNAFSSNFLDEEDLRSKINENRNNLFFDLSNKKLEVKSKHYSKHCFLSKPNIKIKSGNTIFISATRKKKMNNLDKYYIDDDSTMFSYREEKFRFPENNIVVEAKIFIVKKNAKIECKNFAFLGESIYLKKNASIYIEGDFISLGCVNFGSDSGIYRINDPDDYDYAEKKSKFITFENLFLFYKKNGEYHSKTKILENKTEFNKYITFSKKHKQILIE